MFYLNLVGYKEIRPSFFLLSECLFYLNLVGYKDRSAQKVFELEEVLSELSGI